MLLYNPWFLCWFCLVNESNANEKMCLSLSDANALLTNYKCNCKWGRLTPEIQIGKYIIQRQIVLFFSLLRIVFKCIDLRGLCFLFILYLYFGACVCSDTIGARFCILCRFWLHFYFLDAFMSNNFVCLYLLCSRRFPDASAMYFFFSLSNSYFIYIMYWLKIFAQGVNHFY